MAEYAVTITYDIPSINGSIAKSETIVLDTIEDVTVNKTMDITTHPIVNGDMVADHEIKQPLTMNISGAFSTKEAKAIVVNSTEAALADVQQLFEEIMDNGYLCKIVKIQYVHGEKEDTERMRFSQRSDMVLSGISWTEKINTLGFTLDFTQVLIAEVQDATVSEDDAFLPNITEPETLNFTETFLDFEMVDKMVVSTLIETALLDDGFLAYIGSMKATGIAALGVAIGVAIAVATLIPGVGWATVGIAAAIGAAVVVVIGVVKFLRRLINSTKYKIKQFKKYKQDKKSQKEVVRFCNFEGEIHKQLDQLNTVLAVRKINVNAPQECMLTIGNNYYIFTFERNNVNNTYSCKIEVMANEIRTIKVIPDVRCALHGMDECTDQNMLFRADETGEWVYLMQVDEEEKDENDLSTYYILISQINVNNYNNLIHDVIKNALCY